MAGERYVRFPTHEDNVQEIISADHINAADNEIQIEEQQIFQIRDTEFQNKALFILQNHPVANALWIDLFQDNSRVDMPNSPGLAFNAEESSISFDDTLPTPSTDAVLVSRPWTPQTGSPVNNIILFVDHYVPDGAMLTYYISNDGGQNFAPINPNSSEPVQLATSGQQLVVKAHFQRTTPKTPSPVIYAWAVLYDDVSYRINIPDNLDSLAPEPFKPMSHNDLIDVLPDQHHPQKHAHDGTDGSGLVSHKVLIDVGPDDHHPKIHKHSGLPGENDKIDLEAEVKGTLPVKHLPIVLFTGMPGTTMIYRDPANGDSVVRVTSPDQDTFLMRDTNGNVTRVLSIMGDVATDEFLDYGLDAAGNFVLQDVRKYVKDIQAPDVQAIINGNIPDQTKESSWTLPYIPTTPQVVATPTGFGVAMNTPNIPTFRWDPITDPDIVGVQIYYLPVPDDKTPLPTYPNWKVWTYVVPVNASEYTPPYSLDPGHYYFGIAALNQNGWLSSVAPFGTIITV
jgi:hypothetical protein